MKPNLKISRANFHNVGNFSWLNYIIEILDIKYNVIVDSYNPDIVLYSNLFYNDSDIDYYTGQPIRGIDSYNDSVKKIFITGEVAPDYNSILEKNNHYVLGYEHIDHVKYLRFPTYVLDAYVLHNEGGMFDDNFSWLTAKKDSDAIFNSKKHFCSIVQNSYNRDREILYNLINNKYCIKACGNFKTTVSENELLNPLKYHNYSSTEYIGKIDGLTYRDKVIFFSDCHFNIAFQYTNTNYLTQEKLIHAFAAQSIPIFFGNQHIEEEGFNPDSFINCHKFNSLDDAFYHIDSLYMNSDRMKKIYSEPIFVNNTLPEYFNPDYLLSFLEKVLYE